MCELLKVRNCCLVSCWNWDDEIELSMKLLIVKLRFLLLIGLIKYYFKWKVLRDGEFVKVVCGMLVRGSIVEEVDWIYFLCI